MSAAGALSGASWPFPGMGSRKDGGGISLGKAEKGPSLLPLFMGGRPRVLPVPPGRPLFQAEDTTLAPCLRFRRFFEGVMADLGSFSQNPCLVEGVIADCG